MVGDVLALNRIFDAFNIGKDRSLGTPSWILSLCSCWFTENTNEEWLTNSQRSEMLNLTVKDRPSVHLTQSQNLKLTKITYLLCKQRSNLFPQVLLPDFPLCPTRRSTFQAANAEKNHLISTEREGSSSIWI